MRVAPVSADLLIRLALVAAGVGLAYYLWRRTTSAVGDAVGDAFDAAGAAVSDVADAIIVGTNPANPDNWVNQGATAIGGALVDADGPGRNADGSWTVGGWLYDVVNPGWSDNLSGVINPAPAPVAPPTPTGGAAFGFFPQLGRGNVSAVQTIAQRGRVVGGL